MKANVVLMAIGPLALAGCIGPFSEDFDSHYDNVETARGQGAFQRGWLPEIVPKEATDIWEMHNIDTNYTWACFAIPQGPDSVRALIQKQHANRTSGPISDGPGDLFHPRKWWPSSMSRPEIEAYQFHDSNRFTVFVGIDAAIGKVCLHRK